MSLLQVSPIDQQRLDPGFCPITLGDQNYGRRAEQSGGTVPTIVALERADGSVTRMDLQVSPDPQFAPADTIRFVERKVKSLLWNAGGSILYLSGPAFMTAAIRDHYRIGGKRDLDVRRMEMIFGEPFQIKVTVPEDIPPSRSNDIRLGGFQNGCRIGFDLGASDYKLAAVQDGKVRFTTEIPWDPGVQTDPDYHIRHIHDGLRLAATHLPRVDAIGGSAAGAYIENEVMYASLFRSIPQDQFQKRIRPLFRQLAREWNVPFKVLNDGEVTALAGSISMGMSSLLGIAMGSSEAAGYVNRRKAFSGDYHELAYVPVDYSPTAPAEPISQDNGCGAQYFSQQAVARLASVAGFEFDPDEPLPSRLKSVQSLADAGNPQATEIFTTIGTYLGYSIPWYHTLMPFQNLLVLGRVTSGSGGTSIIQTARQILQQHFPHLGVEIHVPDERMRRVGQAVAAASLPAIN